MKTHEIFMQRCLQLAGQGEGFVAPNPMVGAVIVYQNKIIGEGFHAKFGEAHAEVHAINSVKHSDLLTKSILYVNLEPCAHFGKTPPCADLIISKQIPEVVVGTVDPFAQVKGKGVEKLQKAGCKVTVGVLEEECKFLNRRFFVFHQQKRPYIILKWAQSQDGFIDIVRSAMPSAPNWLTHPYTRLLVHQWRSSESAIMVGTNTALIDNPKLNVRDWYGNNPIRIVIDKDLSLPSSLALFDGSIATLVFTSKMRKDAENIKYLTIDFSSNIVPQIVEKLFELNIQSLIVEGGSVLLNSFIETNLWDEARVFTAINKRYGNGIISPKLSISTKKEFFQLNNDLLEIFYNPL